MTNFSEATSRLTLVGDEQNELTAYHSIVVWGALAEKCGNNLAKGDKVLVEGRLQTRSYETDDGQKRRVTEVVAELVAPEIWGDRGGGALPDDHPALQLGRDVTDEPA